MLNFSAYNDEKGYECVLDENDKLFASIRHQFIYEALHSVNAAVKEYANQSAAPSDATNSDNTVESLKQRILSLPDLIERKKQLDGIVNFSKDLEKVVRSTRKINLIAEFEQTLATGVSTGDVDSKKLREGLDKIILNEKIM
jgi:hypothetical protein